MAQTNSHFAAALPPGEEIPMGGVPAIYAARRPDGVAVHLDDQVLTWSTLDARVNQRARRMRALGVAAGDMVTIGLPNGFGFYETTFAIWRLGATPNVVSPKLPQVELDAILELARPSLLIGPASASGFAAAWLAADDQSHITESTAPLEPDAASLVAPHWKAMTSGGSTGRPKIIIDHAPATWHPGNGVLGQRPGGVVLNPGPLYHNAPFSMIFAALCTGATVIEMGRFDAARALSLIEKHRVEWVNLVPTMMHRIWRLPAEQRERADLSSLKIVFHMASACPPWLKQEWINWLGPDRIWELYGCTERHGRTLIDGNEWLAHKGSVGKVSVGSSMQTFDEHGRPCPVGEVGEIHFLPDTGRNSTYHYVGAVSKSHGDWESTGDMGYLDAEGYLYLVDRRTDMIVSGGANIYPAEVEAALDAHPSVASSAVIGLPDEDLGQRVHAIVQWHDVVPALDASAQRQASITTFLADQLVRYKIPRSFEFVDTPLRDDAGKVRRSMLRAERIASFQPSTSSPQKGSE